MWVYGLVFGLYLFMLRAGLRTPKTKENKRVEALTEGGLCLFQYLTGFRYWEDRVPMLLGVTDEDFVFMDARKGWDLDLENPDIVCVVSRSGIERVTLYRKAAASERMRVLGHGEGLELLLTEPEHGLVLLQLDLVDDGGLAHQPVFLLDTGQMMPGEDEQMLAFMCAKGLDPQPEGYLIETTQSELN